jgi:YHS domain-containing protein
MVKDPVCGMEVNERHAGHRTQYRGDTYYFCSESCKAAFENHPEKYVDALKNLASEKRKVAVVGAGQVGATFSFALMMSGLASSIVLIDMNSDLSEGHTMDLNHGLSFAHPTRIFAGDYPDCKGADIVIVTAGAAQKPNETRLDLVKKKHRNFQRHYPQSCRSES